jgi:hypothetical protein
MLQAARNAKEALGADGCDKLKDAAQGKRHRSKKRNCTAKFRLKIFGSDSSMRTRKKKCDRWQRVFLN